MHKPVLLKEVIFYLDPHAGDKFIDATVGWTGHARVIAEEVKPNGKILGVNWDEEEMETVKKEVDLPPNLELAKGSFAELQNIAVGRGFGEVEGIIFDLGFSSWQIERSGRGFSFQKDEPLDMRFGNNEITASQILNTYPYDDLSKIFRTFGEERFTSRIVKEIVRSRKEKPIKSTSDLIELIKKVVPRKGKFHPATKVFQALRIAVNREFENLKEGLGDAFQILSPAGKIGVIAFHSGEDRIVKNTFRNWKKEKLGKQITKKPIRPSEEEINNNPRSRSAKLRVFKKNDHL